MENKYALSNFYLYVIFNIKNFSSEVELLVAPIIQNCDVTLQIEIKNNTNKDINFLSGYLTWSNSVFGVSLIVQKAGANREVFLRLVLLKVCMELFV